MMSTNILEKQLLCAQAHNDSAPLPFCRVHHVLKCPVVGVCLSLGEQRKVVRKARILAENAHPFDIHELLVSMTDEDNALARRVDALLRKKYDQAAAPLRRQTLLEFLKSWNTAFSNGSFAAELWAAATRPDLPVALQRHVFGCVHMAMHEALDHVLEKEEQLRKFRQERQRGEEKFCSVKLGLATAHKELRRLRAEKDALQRQNTRIHAENILLRENLSAVRSDRTPQEGAFRLEERAQIATLTLNLEHAHAQLRTEQAQHAETLASREVLREFTLQLQKEIGQLLKNRAACSHCPDGRQCKSCPRRVLIVGGMSRMESLYRQVVEDRGDAFEYHDGCPGNVGTLKNCLQRADLVLCPVNCNSHRACLLVKDLCKKYKKDLHMMPSFSLSAVTRVIEGDENRSIVN